MEEKKIKKKLTLSISSKKKSYNVPDYSKNNHKTSVVIDKRAIKPTHQRRSFERNQGDGKYSTGYVNKTNQKTWLWDWNHYT